MHMENGADCVLKLYRPIIFDPNLELIGQYFTMIFCNFKCVVCCERQLTGSNLSFKLILRVNKNILVIQSVLLHHGSGQFDRVPIEIQLAHFFSCLLEHNNKYINYLTWFISVIDFQLEWKKAEKKSKIESNLFT